VADQIAFELESKGKKVLVDDRKGGAGGKFKDSDLLGIPVRITAGKLAGEGIVELKYRHESEKCELTIKEVLDKF
jgi:prolyl-tRNA synthetase